MVNWEHCMHRGPPASLIINHLLGPENRGVIELELRAGAETNCRARPQSRLMEPKGVQRPPPQHVIGSHKY